jgi:hypothetical protein
MHKIGTILFFELLYQHLEWLSKIVNYTQLHLVTKYRVEQETSVIRSRISKHAAAMFFLQTKPDLKVNMYEQNSIMKFFSGF